MRRLLATLAAVLPLAGAAQTPAPSQPGTPMTRLVVLASLATGGELGLDHGKAGVFELEGVLGYDLGAFRPELGATIGLEPDTHIALRPGVRVPLPNLPIQLRAAFDAANSRNAPGLCWRWLLLGVSAEVRWTSVMGLFAEVDSGAPLADRAGMPLLVRAGMSFRL
jgi:hypothetical protein